MTCKNGKQSKRCKNTHVDMTQYERETKSVNPILHCCIRYTAEFGWGAATAIYDVSAEYRMERSEQGTKQLYALCTNVVWALLTEIRCNIYCYSEGSIHCAIAAYVRQTKSVFSLFPFIFFAAYFNSNSNNPHTLADMTPLVVSVSSGAHARDLREVIGDAVAVSSVRSHRD